MRLAVPARSLRMANADARLPESIPDEHGPVHRARRIFVQPVLVDALHHTDHLVRSGAALDAQRPSAAAGSPASSRAKSSEINDHAAARLDIVPSDVASRNDSRAHGFEIAGRRPSSICAWAAHHLPRSSRLRRRPIPRAAPSIGTSFAKPADATPGSAAILSRISRCMRVYLLGVGGHVVRDPNPRRLNRRRVRKTGIDVA